jgi:6-phosphogluconolactonase
VVLPTAEDVALRAAAEIAAAAREAVQARGRFLLAVSGGNSPTRMFELLADEDVPWGAVELFQVDERVAPIADPARNLAALQAALLDPLQELPLVHPMPVDAPDLEAAAERYAHALQHHGGIPPVLDLVHLGLGDDGHTASLVPGDPVLDAAADVAVTGTYRGHRRMTLTYPVINRARRILWLVTGADKAVALSRLRAGDPGIPAGHIRSDHALVLSDREANAN